MHNLPQRTDKPIKVARTIIKASIATFVCQLLSGCGNHTAPRPSSSTSPSSTSSTLPSPSPTLSAQAPTVSQEDAQEFQDLNTYSDTVVKTWAIIKQAESTALDESPGVDPHSRIQSAKSLMGKASDLYDSHALTTPGFSDVDSFMRDGMYQDNTAFDDLDFAVNSSDPDTAKAFQDKGKEAYMRAGEDFKGAHLALDEHFTEAERKASGQQ